MTCPRCGLPYLWVEAYRTVPVTIFVHAVAEGKYRQPTAWCEEEVA